MALNPNTNIGLEFNKRIFININTPEKFKKDNFALFEHLSKVKLADLNPEQLDVSKKLPNDSVQSFTLETAGQGLLIGLGNEHGTGKSKNEFKMGFHFDYSTGIPFITGHLLKGRIRSFFPIAYKNEEKRKKVLARLKEDIKSALNKELKDDEIEVLQNAIFEGKQYEKIDGKNVIKSVSRYKMDTFLGAYPSKSVHPSFTYKIPQLFNVGGGNNPRYQERDITIPAGTFLFDDTLAHHEHPLKDPTPLRFLKILPNVEITFQFILHESGGLTVDEKVKSFTYLLQKYGAGNKTSSGYGQFKKSDVNSFNSENLYLKITNFNPVLNEFYVPKVDPVTIELKNENERLEQIRLQDENNRVQNEIRQNELQELSKDLTNIIETNKEYTATVISIDKDNSTYKFKLNEFNAIIIERQIVKEAKKGIDIQEKIVIKVKFSTLKLPFNYTISI